MDTSLIERNSTDYNCTKGLKVFRIPQIIHGDCEVINITIAHVFSDLSYILSFIAIAGNAIKITCISRATRSWTTTQMYLVNLAIAHIVFLIPSFAWGVYLSQQYDWKLGIQACSVMNFINAVGHCGSILFVCVIGVDRMVTIYYPIASIQYKNVKFGKTVVIASWTFNIVIGTLSYIYTTFNVYGKAKYFCGSMYVSNLADLKSLRSFILFGSPNILIPTLVLVPCYLRIVIYLLCQQIRLPSDMGAAVKLDTVYISSFLALCLPPNYALMLTCLLYVTLPACQDECAWANYINLIHEIGRLLNICSALLSPLIYMSKFKMAHYTRFCDCSNLTMCLCKSSPPPPQEGGATVQLVYIACVTDDNFKKHQSR